MKFRDDIDLAKTWVVSDTHFGHENIVGFCHRPEDHEQVMIAEWRKEVPDDATVLHLGDLAYKSNARFRALTSKELTGARKLLILGNHDRQRYSFYKTSGFQIVKPFGIRVNIYGETAEGAFDNFMRAAGPDDGPDFPLDEGWRTVSFSHYPWSDEEDGLMPYGHTRIHGHIHNNGYSRGPFVPFLKDHINLSVEQTKYRPVNLKVLLDAALMGRYERTTEEQIQEARERREALRA